MLPSEIRAQLLGQHTLLRQLATDVRAAISPSARPDQDLRRAIDALSAALLRHNRDEQRLLGEALPVADAWGEVRRVAMDDHHRKEHVALRAALAGSLDSDDWGRVTAAVRKLLDDLLAHMDAEERVLLHPNVLRDDVCVVDPFGG